MGIFSYHLCPCCSGAEAARIAQEEKEEQEEQEDALENYRREQEQEEQKRKKAHVRVHTNERPFACNHCDYAAKLKHHLQSHIKSQHGAASGNKKSTISSASDAHMHACHCDLKTGETDLILYFLLFPFSFFFLFFLFF